MNKAVVITTINPPSEAVRDLDRMAGTEAFALYVVGDARTPADFAIEHGVYLDVAAQRARPWDLAARLPTGHYARKNLGYLAAMAGGSDVIIETDDDNLPLAGFADVSAMTRKLPWCAEPGWINVYAWFTRLRVWPRGLPLRHAKTQPPAWDGLGMAPVVSPICQRLADDNPDVDAVYRLVGDLPVVFDAGRAVALGEGAWCPFNSQNTTWHAPAFELLYLPSTCSMRMCDIWRSFVAQRIAWSCGWSVAFASPTVRQERNTHDLMQDFADELPGTLHNEAIVDTLTSLALAAGQEAIPDNLRRCWRAFVDGGLVHAGELDLLDAWLADVAALRDEGSSS